MDIDSFIISIKTEDLYEDIANDVEKRFDTSNHDVSRPLHTGMEDKLGGKTMTKFAALRSKTYSYLMDDGNSDKKTTGTKKCVI